MRINKNPIGRSWFLVDLIKKNDYKVIAEIGVAKGENARNILEKVELDKFYLVDKIVSPEANLLTDCPPVKQIKGWSVDVAKTIKDGSLDLVFIDANHIYSSVKKDIKAWLPKVRKGGVMSGHDYGNKPGVAKAVDEIFDDINLQLEIDSVNVWWKYV